LLASAEPARAASLAGAALAFAERAGIRFPPRYRRAADLLRDELQCHLGSERTGRAWAEGGQLATSEAIALALAPHGRTGRSRLVTSD